MSFQRLSLFLLGAGMLCASGCAVVFSPSHQHVSVSSTTPGARLVYKDDTVGVGEARLTLSKYGVFHIVKAEKEGYKSRNYCVTLNRHNATVAFVPLDFGVMLAGAIVFQKDITKETKGKAGTGGQAYGYFGVPALLIGLREMQHPKLHRFDSKQVIPELTPMEHKREDEKCLLVNNSAFNIKAADARFVTYRGLKKYNNASGKEKAGRAFAKEDSKIDNTIFTTTLNNTLKKMGFVDTTNHIFPNINNSLYIDATVKKITFHLVESPFYTAVGSNVKSQMANTMFSVELSIDWDVFDFYKQKLETIRTVDRSDFFTITPGDTKDAIGDAVLLALNDNMEYSILNLKRQLSDKGLLKVTTTKENVDVVMLDRPSDSARKIDDFYKSSVTVKVDDGFGNGAILSADGYIVTNYHLIAGSKKIEIIFNDSSKAEAEIVRKNSESDMVLLKVKKTGLVPFLMSNESDPELGKDVWVVGVSKNLDLGPTVSRGIISGIRKTNGMNMLQTDASLNSGNSGSALVGKDGKVEGIISMKIKGRGVEGIGFALSAKDVMEKLGVKYK